MQIVDNKLVMSTQELMRSDLLPFCKMRQILTEELHHSIDDVQGMKYRGETVEVPSEDGEWESHQPAGRQQYTLILADGEEIHFLRDTHTQDVRLGELPGSSKALP